MNSDYMTFLVSGLMLLTIGLALLRFVPNWLLSSMFHNLHFHDEKPQQRRCQEHPLRQAATVMNG